MAVRFDLDTRSLDLSVNDLLESRLLRSLGFSNRGGYERLWLGQAIHSRYQEGALEADPTFRREVKLVVEMIHRGWTVRIQGRADGLRRDPDGGWVVEEIKSIRRGGQLSPTMRELYERQALLYVWMLAQQDDSALTVGDGEDVSAELVLIEIGSDREPIREPLQADLRGLEVGVKRRLNALIGGFEAERKAQARRRQAAEEMAFPFPDPRPGQERILDAAEHALEHGEHLLVEAATGLGKTVAAVYPALRYCLNHNKRLFVLTAKTLQQEMVVRVLQMLEAGVDGAGSMSGDSSREGGAFHALRLRAKAKMCANDQLICHEEYCPFAKEYYLKLQTTNVIDEMLYRHRVLEPDDVYEASRRAEVCPFETSLELSGRVQVTVCDYNYAFDPYVALTDFGEDADLRDTVLIIDELHNLVDRGRGYYSPLLSARAARLAAERVRFGGEPVHRRLERVCRKLAECIESAVRDRLEELPGGTTAAEVKLPEDDLWALRPSFDGAFIDYLEYQRENKSFQPEDPFVTLYFDFLRFLNGLMLSDGNTFSHCVEQEGGDSRLRILCKDPSRFLGKVMRRCHAVIGLSATLSPPEFYRDLLGFDADRAVVLSVPNPFPPEHRRVVIDDSVATTYRERPRFYGRIANQLADFADSVPGNCLALFPSYRFLAEVAQLLPTTSKRVLVQQRSDSDGDREAILDALRSSLFNDVLLLAVAGGVFAEGVDYPGDMLRAVAIIGPCLPAVSLEKELLQAYYDERFDRGFEYAFVVPGMTRVVQAAGRLIRSDKDTGVIALFDQRFLRHPYRRHLPADWGDAGCLAGVPAGVAADFFATFEESVRIGK